MKILLANPRVDLYTTENFDSWRTKEGNFVNIIDSKCHMDPDQSFEIVFVYNMINII